MVRKRCRLCEKLSYSLSPKGVWICPHCGEDITAQPVQYPDAASNRVLPLKGSEETTCLN
ncbi:MAG TPA: hypothetical protein VF234_08140 [Limnochordia bacterium]